MNKRLEQLRDELPSFNEQDLLLLSIRAGDYEDNEGHKYAADFRIGFRYGYTRGVNAGFDSSTAEHEKIIAELEDALSFYSSRENWIRSYVVNVDAEALQPSSWADKLKQQDCALLNFGGGRARLAIQKLKEFRGEV